MKLYTVFYSHQVDDYDSSDVSYFIQICSTYEKALERAKQEYEKTCSKINKDDSMDSYTWQIFESDLNKDQDYKNGKVVFEIESNTKRLVRSLAEKNKFRK